MEQTMLFIYLTPELKEKIKLHCVKRKITIKDFITDLIEKKLN